MGELLSSVFNEIRYVRFVYALLLAIAFWAAQRAGPRRTAKPAALALLALFLLSWPPVGWMLNSAIEGSYRYAEPPPADVQAVVVFSGGSFAPDVNRPFSYLADGTLLRCRTAARVHTAANRAPVVVCGRSASGAPDASPVWDLMARQLEAWGVAENRIRLEPSGRSTYEQSLHAAELLRTMGAQRIAVVTEGFHMRRALGCLRAQGLEAFPAPAGSRGLPHEIRWRDFLPNAAAVGVNEEAIREICALAVYKLRGRI